MLVGAQAKGQQAGTFALEVLGEGGRRAGCYLVGCCFLQSSTPSTWWINDFRKPGTAALRRPDAVLLAAFLDERADELLSVGFKHAVDLIEKIVHALRGG